MSFSNTMFNNFFDNNHLTTTILHSSHHIRLHILSHHHHRQFTPPLLSHSSVKDYHTKVNGCGHCVRVPKINTDCIFQLTQELVLRFDKDTIEWLLHEVEPSIIAVTSTASSHYNLLLHFLNVPQFHHSVIVQAQLATTLQLMVIETLSPTMMYHAVAQLVAFVPINLTHPKFQM